MKYLLLLLLPFLSFTTPQTIPVTIDWTQCPNAQGMMTFTGPSNENVYMENGAYQTVWLEPGDYCITFETNAPVGVVSTTYSSGTVTHYDATQCGETLMESYVFFDDGLTIGSFDGLGEHVLSTL